MDQVPGASSPRSSMLGCGAMLFEAREALGDAAQQRVWRVAVAAPAWPGVREVVPGMNNLMIVFDPAVLAPGELRLQVEREWQDESSVERPARVVELPVVYGGAAGPDLPVVAEHAGLSIEDVVRLHAEALYTVYFLGAHPGFAYLGGLPRRLHTPRRAEPRLHVAAGTVAIGGAQTGAIAQSGPSGWQLIGRTETVFFDPSGSPPTLLAPGDRVRFRSLGMAS